METKEYEKLVDKNSIKDNKFLNCLSSFLIGGLVGALAQVLFSILYNNFEFSLTDSYMYTTIFFVILASILTGFNIFDKVVSFAKCGLIVPITGFAHSITASMIDHKKEGFINGIGSNFLKLAGSIILYGVVFASVFALIKGVIM